MDRDRFDVKNNQHADMYRRDPQDRPTADSLLWAAFCNVDPHFNFLDTELYAKIAPQITR